MAGCCKPLGVTGCVDVLLDAPSNVDGKILFQNVVITAPSLSHRQSRESVSDCEWNKDETAKRCDYFVRMRVAKLLKEQLLLEHGVAPFGFNPT